ncbi:MAG: GNAT family N-acetyltransferase [Oscillospiraceae bacterium]
MNNVTIEPFENDNINDITIEPFGIKHIEDVSEMHFQVLDGWSMKGLISDIANNSTQSFVAMRYGRALAFCSYLVADDAELLFLCTHPIARNRGLASALLKDTMAKLPVNTVVLEVRSQNEEAIRLYKKLGFASLGVRKGFYSTPGDDAVVMEYNKHGKDL